MSEKSRILSEFKRQLVTFFDELIAQLPREPDLVLCRVMINDQVNILDTVRAFQRMLDSDNGEMRDMVKNRNEAFFLERNVFQVLSAETNTRMKRLWCTQLSSDDKFVIWQWFTTFIHLADQFTKAHSEGPQSPVAEK